MSLRFGRAHLLLRLMESLKDMIASEEEHLIFDRCTPIHVNDGWDYGKNPDFGTASWLLSSSTQWDQDFSLARHWMRECFPKTSAIARPSWRVLPRDYSMSAIKSIHLHIVSLRCTLQLVSTSLLRDGTLSIPLNSPIHIALSYRQVTPPWTNGSFSTPCLSRTFPSFKMALWF
jgi:hypothetical protein